MSQQQSRQMADPINENQPLSPKKETDSLNSPSFSLSPKQESASRKNQTSPGVKKNKLDTLKKLIEKKMAEKIQIQNQNKKISQLLQQKQNEEKLLQQRISNFSNNNCEVSNITNIVHEKENELKIKKQEVARAIQQMQLYANTLQKQHLQISSKITCKKQEINKKIAQKIAQKEFQVFELQKSLSQLRTKHAHNKNSLQNTKTALNDQKREFQQVSKNFETNKHGVNSQQLNLLSVRISQKQAEQKRKHESINQIKKKITQLQNNQSQISEGNNQQTQVKLNQLKKQINNLKTAASNTKNQIVTKKKQIDQVIKNNKNQQKDLQKSKNKKYQLLQKLKKLEEQKEQVQKLPKKIKYQERPPQQFQQKKKQHQKLCKKLQLIKLQIENQKKTYQTLIPPKVIQDLKQKITKAHQDNQKFNYLTKANKQISEENKKLDQTKEALQWEINPDIKTSQLNRQKEQTKSKFLDQQVSQIRKKSIQINNKLEEYAKAYPDFKPEKKQKKVEIPAVIPVNVKSSSVKQEQKQPKKKKGNMAKQDSVVMEQKIQKSPVHQVKKSPVKKQQENKQAAKQVQKKVVNNVQNGVKAKKNKKNK